MTVTTERNPRGIIVQPPASISFQSVVVVMRLLEGASGGRLLERAGRLETSLEGAAFSFAPRSLMAVTALSLAGAGDACASRAGFSCAGELGSCPKRVATLNIRARKSAVKFMKYGL